MAKYYNVGVRGDTKQYQKSMLEASSITKSFGSTIQMYLGPAALASIGVAAIRMSTDFSMAMTRIETLVGVSREEVAKMRTEVKDMAGELGKSPQELAEGLYYITSSGLEGATAMDALAESAKASALGMGELGQVADAVTSVMNAYGHETYSANRVTNILLNTVKVGKIEADALAGSMGKVIPTASRMGVSFEEVGAALATMSLSGIDAAEATTSLNQLLSTFLKPSDEADKIITHLYGSVEELRNQIREKGLLTVLTDLKEKLGDNVSNTAALFNEKRALKGMLALTGSQAETYVGILGDLKDKTDSVTEATERLNEEAGQKWAKLVAKTSSLMIDWGDSIAENLMDIESDWHNFWEDLANDPLVQAFNDVFRENAEAVKFLDNAVDEASSSFKYYGKAQEEAFDAAMKLRGGVVKTNEDLEDEADRILKVIEALDKAKPKMEQFYTEWEMRVASQTGPSEDPKAMAVGLELESSIDETQIATIQKITKSVKEQKEEWNKVAMNIGLASQGVVAFGQLAAAATNADAKRRYELALWQSTLAIPLAYLQGLVMTGGNVAIATSMGAIAAAQAATIATLGPPSFAIGTTGYGGLAKVHEGESLMMLPNQTRVMSRGMSSISRNKSGGQSEIRLEKDQVVLILNQLNREYNFKSA